MSAPKNDSAGEVPYAETLERADDGALLVVNPSSWVGCGVRRPGRVTEDDFPNDGKPIAVRVLSVPAELASLRTQLDTDRRAAKAVIEERTADLERTRSQLESAMRFILGDPTRARAWALRGPS